MAFVISLPTDDRSAAHTFYRDGLGLEPFGALGDDGLPEPLQLRLSSTVSLMLVPTGGFGWVLGERPAAPAGSSEVLLGLDAPDAAAVDALVERAVAHGGTVVTAPGDRPWGYQATVADPDGHVWMVAVRQA